jgi:hypothetical protein
VRQALEGNRKMVALQRRGILKRAPRPCLVEIDRHEHRTAQTVRDGAPDRRVVRNVSPL